MDHLEMRTRDKGDKELSQYIYCSTLNLMQL